MNRISVSSSNIHSIGYENETLTLEVEFHSSGLYQYSGVPKAVFQGLIAAQSKGSYFQNYVKNRYPCRKVR